MKRAREDPYSDEEAKAWTDDDFMFEPPPRKQLKCSIPQNESRLVSENRLAARRNTLKGKYFTYLSSVDKQELAWLSDEIQKDIVDFLGDAVNSNKDLTIRSVVGDGFRPHALVRGILKRITVGENAKNLSETSGYLHVKQHTSFHHVHLVGEPVNPADRAVLIRSKSQVNPFVELLSRQESQHSLRRTVFFLTATVDSDLKMHRKLIDTLATLQSKVVILYMIHDQDIVGQVLQEQLQRKDTVRQTELLRMLWNTFEASKQIKTWIKEHFDTSMVCQNVILIPPLTAFYLFLYLRRFIQQVITTHNGYQDSVVRVCNITLQSFSVSLLKTEVSIKEASDTLNKRMRDNMDFMGTPEQKDPLVTVHVSSGQTLIMSVNNNECPYDLLPVTVDITDELANKMKEETDLIQTTPKNITIVDEPPGSMALHSSLMFPLFVKPDEAQKTLLESVFTFCDGVSPGSVVRYSDSQMVDPATKRHTNLFTDLLGRKSNFLYVMTATMKEMIRKQRHLEEEVASLKEEFYDFKSKSLLSITDSSSSFSSRKTLKNGRGSLYKDRKNESIRIQYRKTNGKWSNKSVPIYMSRSHQTRRPLEDFYKKAISLGLSHQVAMNGIEKLVAEGVLVKE